MANCLISDKLKFIMWHDKVHRIHLTQYFNLSHISAKLLKKSKMTNLSFQLPAVLSAARVITRYKISKFRQKEDR